ncbi:hypothetical protein M404DRAFT_8361 [Pisolithus tinctorius Marx 270]|uniref:Uncharacterized protein n=1 Tax=Pisolithus tinctorius Marx 270 TaxID=870435 RepID=A0A0C3PGP2_PISTI|nr:hypothetical protein M404DRAFT_8361 [Pisolithus tinctorius Marx 270]
MGGHTCQLLLNTGGDSGYDELWESNTPWPVTDIINLQGGTNLTQMKGKQQFHDFVITTWNDLVLQEMQANGRKPSICIFCRMDIGIWMEWGKAVEYFMNEVEWTPMTSIWLGAYNGHTMETLTDTFSMVFRQWLLSIQNPYIF